MSAEEKETHITGEKNLSASGSDAEKYGPDEYVGFLDQYHKHILYEKLGHGRIEGDSEKEQSIEDVEYLFQKIDALPISKAIEILNEILEYHDDDPNYSAEDYELAKELVQGKDANPDKTPEEWAFQAKLIAGLSEYFSPYPEVRAIASPLDDPTIPVETIRAYFLAFIWTIIGTGVNEFFSHRRPSISLSSSVCQMLLYPCGKFLEKVLPDWGFTLFGTRHSLNPGPWSYKEQMFATICFNVAIGGIYVASNIIVQKLDLFYGGKWVSLGYQVLLAISTQLLGFGFAGVLRKIVIYPSRAVWPTLLPTLALNQALLKPEKKEYIHGWTITRYYFFFVVAIISFLWFWVPDYLFEALSNFNWMTWIKPENFNLATITGSVSGLGLNPVATFDWNMIVGNGALSIPFYSYTNQMIGSFIAFFAIIGVYYSNYLWSAYLPINSNGIFANTGDSYAVTEILTNKVFDTKKYQQYGPPYYTAANLVVYGAFFAIYPFGFIYTCYIERKAMWNSIKSLKKSLTSIGRSNFTDFKDPQSRMMAKYKETPDWWFLVILVISIVFGILCVKVYPANTPVWGIFFTIGINFVFLIPLTLIQAVTGFGFGLNVLVELIIGYAIPGNGDALNTLKAYGYNINGQAQNYISDQKMAHYAKVPPLAIFRGQLLCTILQIIVCLAVVNFSMSNIKDFCDPKQPDKFSCPGERTFYSASVLWGVIGPKRVFNGLYPILQYTFLIGALLAVVCIAIKRFFPKQTKYFQPTLIIGGMLIYAPNNLAYVMPGWYVNYAFMSYIKNRFAAWWEKYNYVLSAGLDSGLAFSAVIIFFAVQYKGFTIDWWGNTVPYVGLDGEAAALLDPSTAPDGYFGKRFGDFP